MPPAAPVILDSAGALNQGVDANAVVDADLPVARLIGRDKRVLVVGRRTRGLCRTLVTAGCNVSAAPESRSVALGRKLPAGPFDAVALVRLVEYIDDPVGLLRRIARLLAADGFVAAVPNITRQRPVALACGRAARLVRADAFPQRCYGGRRLGSYSSVPLRRHRNGACREAFDCHPDAIKGNRPDGVHSKLTSDIDATSAFVVSRTNRL
jgi:hypothetical protein